MNTAWKEQPIKTLTAIHNVTGVGEDHVALIEGRARVEEVKGAQVPLGRSRATKHDGWGGVPVTTPKRMITPDP